MHVQSHKNRARHPPFGVDGYQGERVVQGSEHPVAVHLQLSTVRLGQLSEESLSPARALVIRSAVASTLASPLWLSVSTLRIDTFRARELGGGCPPGSSTSRRLHHRWL
jgi:hypothetical protein